MIEERSIELYSKNANTINDCSDKNLYLNLINYKEMYKKMLEDALYYLEQEGLIFPNIGRLNDHGKTK